MSLRILPCFFLLLLAAPWARAQEADPIQRLGLRVSSVAGPRVIVDRGESDKLEVGDRVSFSPKRGGTFHGRVVELREREAIVELDDPKVRLEPGTRGEVAIPTSRFATKRAEPETAPGQEPEKDGTEAPDHPGWKNKDEGYTKGAPLLSDVPPVRPRERARKTTGYAYLLADVTSYLDSDFTNSYFRTGTDLTVENVLGKGGNFRLNVEGAYLTDINSHTGWDLLVRRLSYYRGGTRFDAGRFEFGRFLQYGMPEFGILDGLEYDRRLENGHGFGFSAGFLPEPMHDHVFNPDDFGLAAFYRFVSDPRETVDFRLGFKKTFNNTNADRDLVVAKFRWLPRNGWFVDAVAFLDYYTGGDVLKSGGFEFTYALVTASRTWATGNGIEFTYQHQAYPDIEATEFLQPDANQVSDFHYDRVTFEGWRWLGTKMRVRTNLVGWADQDDTGGAADLSVEWRNVWAEGTRLDLTGLFDVAKYEDVYGGRVAFGWSNARYSWDVLYELTWRHLDGFPDDRDDLVQHWVRVSGGVHVWRTWDLSWYGQLILYDEENSWSLGINLTKRF